MNEATSPGRDDTFDRLGQITRQLNAAMTELGFDVQLHRIAHEIPDARDRLSYVGLMTENAATKVLNLVDAARPGCSALVEHAQGTRRDLQRLIAEADGGAPRLRDGLARLADFVDGAEAHALQQEQALSDIMMAQDFQDLSGQVIKKVIDIISRTERQLVQLLTDTAPEHVMAAVAAANAEALQGPATPENALKQDDVDDLLAQMGF